ncbi:MAG: BON domain-containing protein [Vicinamibacterales bacterium]
MTTATLTGTDLRLRNFVVRELDWDPDVDASAIGVSAQNGVVTLTGFVDTYAGKLAAERVAKRVRGVRAIANDVTVRLTVDRTDADIAADAAAALKVQTTVADKVTIAVHHGRIGLTGTVEWFTQKEAAADAVKHVPGVRGVANYIDVASKPVFRDVHRRIVSALHRNADLDARNLRVEVAGDVVTLTGTVGSWLQRDAAERGAASAPGIRRVQNRIVVVPSAVEGVDEDEIC